MSKKQYWLIYSSEDFHAEVISAPSDHTQDELEDAIEFDLRGPFKTLKEARDEGITLANGDIGEFKRMKADIKSLPAHYDLDEPIKNGSDL